MGKYYKVKDWVDKVKQFMLKNCSSFRSPCTMLSKSMHNDIDVKKILIRYAKPMRMFNILNILNRIN